MKHILLLLLLILNLIIATTNANNTNEIKCIRGQYMDRDLKKCIACPAGRYGRSYGLTSPNCDGLCDVGHFCPPGSTSKKEQPCPSGRYGNARGLTNAQCSGPCEAGYTCRPRSTTSREQPCGEVYHYCPQGSGERRDVSIGSYTIGNDEYTRIGQIECETGYYCIKGLKYQCAAGKYGNSTGLHTSDCGGWWVDSVHNIRHWVNGTCPIGKYCPIASTIPTACPAGRYGGTTELKDATCSGPCAKGFYCPSSSIYVNQTACPKGRYGNVTGLQTKACNPDCHEGKYCLGQTEIYATDGNYLLPIGHPDFVGIPDDLYDSNTKATMCDAGYYCELNSPSSRQYKCGGSNKFCPSGSFAPTFVSEGYYTVGGGPGVNDESGSEETRHSQKECPQGHYCINGIRIECPKGKYGTTTGLSTSECDGDCDPGYYCDPASPSQRQHECDHPSVYCPKGSFTPTKVSVGYYTTNGEPRTRSNQSICEPGRYCVNGIKRMCPAGKFGSTYGLSTNDCSGDCFIGHYCPTNSTSGEEVKCPAGKYGGERGLRTPYCSGPCDENFYCPLASISAQELDCPGADFICPIGSGAPISVQSDETLILDTTRRHVYECDKDAALHGICADKVLATRDPDISVRRKTDYEYLDIENENYQYLDNID